MVNPRHVLGRTREAMLNTKPSDVWWTRSTPAKIWCRKRQAWAIAMACPWAIFMEFPWVEYQWIQWHTYGSVSKPCTPVVHIKIAGKWMFIPLKMVLIGIDP